MDTTTLLHGLNLLLGPTRANRLCELFGDEEALFLAKAADLAAAGLDAEAVERFLRQRETLDLATEHARVAAHGIKLLSYRDLAYPSLLLQIAKYPRLLYYKGQLTTADELCIAVVGTRKITGYGRTVTPYLLEPLIESGVTIVSGLAFGVDSLAQKLAADTGHRTIAILGGGLDDKSFYPKEHQLLAQEILDNNGTLLSEYPPGTPPLKHHFIARNRILSGISLGTIVVECSLKSGSLITARYALEQDRSVYAVPGPIYSPQSQGPNSLVKMGALLITQASDILNDLNIQHVSEAQETQDLFGDTAEETALLHILNHEPLSVNELIKQSGLESGRVNAALTFLEMKGKVRNLGAQQYVLAR